MSTTTEINITELFARAKNCLAFIGLTASTEWAEQLRTLLSYESAPDALFGYEDWLASVDEICRKIEFSQLENERQAAVSQHVGTVGERQPFVARVQFTKTFPPRNEDDVWGERHLTILADDEGNVIKYWNLIRLPAPTEEDPKAKRPAVKGERLSFAATVVQHNDYKGVKQTEIQRVTKAALAA